uniref:Uncharacterized protein n=1 Tax=Oryza nivara TaxID=4536 RepID=A0A0E0H5I2_ORYNI
MEVCPKISSGPNELTDQLGPVREAHAPRLYQTAHARDGTEEASASRPLWPEDQPCSSPLALTPRDPPTNGKSNQIIKLRQHGLGAPTGATHVVQSEHTLQRPGRRTRREREKEAKVSWNRSLASSARSGRGTKEKLLSGLVPAALLGELVVLCLLLGGGGATLLLAADRIDGCARRRCSGDGGQQPLAPDVGGGGGYAPAAPRDGGAGGAVPAGEGGAAAAQTAACPMATSAEETPEWDEMGGLEGKKIGDGSISLCECVGRIHCLPARMSCRNMRPTEKTVKSSGVGTFSTAGPTLGTCLPALLVVTASSGAAMIATAALFARTSRRNDRVIDTYE